MLTLTVCFWFFSFFFFFNDTATTEIYTLSLHDALPISTSPPVGSCVRTPSPRACRTRSEEHTSELQSHVNLVCRLLLEKKKTSRRSSAATTSRPQDRSKLGQPSLQWRFGVGLRVVGVADHLGDVQRGVFVFFLMRRRPPRATLFPYTTLFR